MRLNIQLPSQLKDLSHAQREAILEELRKALDVTPQAPKAKNTEHNIWTRNDEELLADAEEELYQALIYPTMEAMAELIGALGLSYESIEKSFSEEFLEYEDTLIKGKGKADKISDLIELSKKKKQGFMKYLQGASNWSKKKLKELDKILSQKLPDYAKIAEEFMVRASFIAKIRNQADAEALEMVGAVVDRFPKTIEASRRENVVVTQRQKDSVLPKAPKAQPPAPIEPNEKSQGFVATIVTAEELEEARKEWNKLKILPLQPQEVRTTQNAELRATEKLTETSNKHRAGIKQIVLQAVNGRWSAEKLAQALFNAYGDMNRDWRRIAITELAMASNDAYLAGCSEGDQVWVPPVVGSCKHCQKYLEGKTFTVTADPKKMGNDYQQEMNYVWVGKTNFGRNVSAWIPCVPLHPNCRHRFHKVSRFYKVDNAGKPQLKPVHQLIQEERLRRGLGLDPNLPPI